MCLKLYVVFPLRTSVSLYQLSSPLSRPPTPLSDTLDGTPSWSLAVESTLQQQSRQKVKMQPEVPFRELAQSSNANRDKIALFVELTFSFSCARWSLIEKKNCPVL